MHDMPDTEDADADAVVASQPVQSLILVFLGAAVIAAVINAYFKTDWGSVLNITTMIHVLWTTLMGIAPRISTPFWAAWLSPALFCGVCVLLLARKLRPYEVVR